LNGSLKKTDNRSQQHSILKGYNMLLYFAGSMIMYEPSEECVTDFWTKGVLKNLPVTSLNPNFIKAAAQLRESCVDKKVCGRMLRDDYIRLFSESGSPLAPAYESKYLRKRLISGVSKISNVSEFYKSYGWESKFKGKIDDDHLGVELLFLTLLIDKYFVLEDEACRSEMKKEIKRFISEHILSWIPEWNKKVQSNSNTLCFKGIATLILACTEDIFSIVDQDFSTNNSPEFLKN
jgi:putative dimethyl sulfoxide reductase chaperone